MMQPIKVPYNELKALGFEPDDLRDLSEIAGYLDSLETIGLGTNFSNLMSYLGKASVMRTRMTNLFKRIEERSSDGEAS